MASNQRINSSPIDCPTNVKFPSTFTPTTARSVSTITFPPGCKVKLKSHIIPLDYASINSDHETIHYEWSRDSNVFFPSYHTEEFKVIITRLINLTPVSTDNIIAAVVTAQYISEIENITVFPRS
jgi:transcription-repair coupling factor (superfamily II helicase)